MVLVHFLLVYLTLLFLPQANGRELFIRRDSSDIFQGISDCSKVKNAFEKNSSFCGCEFERTLISKNNKTLECSDNLQKFLGTDSSTELAFDKYDRLTSRVTLPCIYQSTTKIEYWNYDEAKEKGVWEDGSQLQKIILPIAGVVIDLDYASYNLSIEGLVMKLWVKCLSSKGKSTVIKTHGYRSYPTSGDFTIKKITTPPTVETTQAKTTVTKTSTINTTITPSKTTATGQQDTFIKTDDSDGTTTIIAIMVPLIIILIFLTAVTWYLWKRRRSNKPSVGTCMDIKPSPSAPPLEINYAKPDVHIYKELDNGNNTKPTVATNNSNKAYEPLEPRYQGNRDVYKELNNTNPVYRELEYEGDKNSTVDNNNMDYDRISDVINDDYYSPVIDPNLPTEEMPNYAEVDRTSKSLS